MTLTRGWVAASSVRPWTRSRVRIPAAVFPDTPRRTTTGTARGQNREGWFLPSGHPLPGLLHFEKRVGGVLYRLMYGAPTGPPVFHQVVHESELPARPDPQRLAGDDAVGAMQAHLAYPDIGTAVL